MGSISGRGNDKMLFGRIQFQTLYVDEMSIFLRENMLLGYKNTAYSWKFTLKKLAQFLTIPQRGDYPFKVDTYIGNYEKDKT